MIDVHVEYPTETGVRGGSGYMLFLDIHSIILKTRGENDWFCTQVPAQALCGIFLTNWKHFVCILGMSKQRINDAQ